MVTEAVQDTVKQVEVKPVYKTMAQVEEEYIFKILGETSGNKTQAAKILGFTLKTLYNKLNSYDARDKAAQTTQS